MQPIWVDFSDNIEDYEVLSPLGTGGFACVYRAKYRANGMEVAIKMINKYKMIQEGKMERVNQEVQIHRQLKHPSILHLYTSFQDDEFIYLVLEHCENGDLETYARMTNGVSEDFAAVIFKQVVDGLLYLHQNKIVHRDIKLKNILVTANKHIKIADFGLATQLKTIDEKHMTMCGTANFISPEAATGSSYGLQTDIWSLGCMLYTLLVGKSPFEGGTVRGTLTKVVMEPHTFPPRLSNNAKDLIDKMLRKRQEERIKLEEILEHPFITHSKKVKCDKYGSISSGNDSGLGRTVSSYEKSRFRSRSEDRMLTSQSNTEQNNKRNLINIDTKPLIGNVRKMYPMRDKFISNNNQMNVKSHDFVMNHVKQSYPSNNIISYSSSNQNSIRSEPMMCQGERAHIINDKYSSWCKDEQFAKYGTKRIISSLVEEPNWNEHNRLLPAIPSSQSKEDSEEIKKLKDEMIPLNSKRMPPTRRRSKTVICSIMSNEDVYVEHIKKKNNTEKVYEVIRISSDGLCISVYDLAKAQTVGPEPPQIPENKATVYSFYNLPSCYYKTYNGARRFVETVRANVPKIRLFTDKAKFLYMENGPDPNCDVYFYDNIMVYKSNGKIKLKSKADGRIYIEDEIPRRYEEYIEHFHQSYEKCVRLESALTQLENATGFSYFPVKVGRIPLKDTPCLQGKENISQNTNSSPMISTFHTPSSIGSSITSRMKSDKNCQPTNSEKKSIPGLGIVTQFSNGINRIDYDDGSILTLKPDGKFIYHSVNGTVNEYNSIIKLPLNVRNKFDELVKVFGNIVQSSSNNNLR